MLWLHIIQHVGFVFAQINNSVLIYLIITKAEKLFGSYKHVMLIFAIFSLLYSWIEVLTQPILHVKSPMLICFLDSPLKYEKYIGYFINCLYCGSFALVISLLAAQFFFRYIVFCREDILSKIEGYKLGFIFIPCLICFVLWFEFVYLGMANTVAKQEFMKEELRKVYDEDTTKVAFSSAMYWSIDENGEKHWNIWEIMPGVGCCCIIIVCFYTILYCAYNIYRTMKSAQSYMSAKTLELNRQLFITLAFQTLLPYIMMYSPVGILLTLPFFDLYVGKMTNLVSASLAVYPSLEPLIAMFCIQEFRSTIIHFYRKKTGKISSMTQSNTSSSMMTYAQ